MKEHFLVSKDAWAREWLQTRRIIFQAKVIAVLPDGSAKVDLIETLRGSNLPTLRPRKTEDTCDITFSVGEEFIYLPDAQGGIQLCDRIAPKPELLRAIREILQERAPTSARPQ
jgi:hypothetical protein